ncbi:hypothetical protein Tco_1171602, partial [Tanacetum coccineum]
IFNTSTLFSRSLGTSRNAECSNCKYLLDNITKFNLEANAEINFLFKLSSFDFAIDITDDAENRLRRSTKDHLRVVVDLVMAIATMPYLADLYKVIFLTIM